MHCRVSLVSWYLGHHAYRKGMWFDADDSVPFLANRKGHLAAKQSQQYAFHPTHACMKCECKTVQFADSSLGWVSFAVGHMFICLRSIVSLV